MHSKPMPESSGTFQDDWQPSDRACPKCNQTGQVFWRLWESSCGGYEDEKFQCRNPECRHVWWIDGIDS